MRPEEALSLIGGSEQKARQSLRPLRFRRAGALGLTVVGFNFVFTWLQENSRYVRHSQLQTAWLLVGGPLLLYAVVTGLLTQPATWGVKVDRRGAAWWLQKAGILGACVALLLGGFGSALGSASSVVRGIVTIVVAAIWTALIEMTRRRMGHHVVWSCLAAVVAWAWIILAVWTSGLATLLVGGGYMVWGIYQFVAAIRDERQRVPRQPVSGVK